MINKITTALILVFSFTTFSTQAQQQQTISITNAVTLAVENSDETKLANTKITSAENELNVTKNHQYPDVKLSGQYMYLTNADVNFKLNSAGSDTGSAGSESQGMPNINQLLIGQANATLPLFSGFKLKNSIKASENMYQAAVFNAKSDTEQLSLKVINNYLNLYKANETVTLVEESLKSAHQRVLDFTAMEQNGLLARNDLLKAQLQESKIKLTLEETIKNKNILNYQLAILLKLPEGTEIQTLAPDYGIPAETSITNNTERSDLEALKFQELATEQNIKIAKSKYFPSIALTGGYIAMDLQNALTVSNAMTFGVGVSYNLSDIFKAKSDVKLAQSKTEEMQYHINMMEDHIKVEIENAKQNYNLALTNYNVYTDSETQAIENYRIVKDKYDNGLVDTNDLLEADIEQLQAKLNLTYAKANITQKYYELLTAQGQLLNTLQQ